MTKVQCRCGAVEIEISAEPIVQFYCHCDDCQAVHGGAYAPESVYPADAVNVVRGDPLTWKLKRNPRVTCRECGTRLFIDVLGAYDCGASMDTCSRRANSSPPFICNASSRSGPSSTTFRIIRPCPSVSAARTKWWGGRLCLLSSMTPSSVLPGREGSDGDHLRTLAGPTMARFANKCHIDGSGGVSWLR